MSETNDRRIYDRCISRVGQLEADNAELRELVADMYRRFHGVVIENWAYSSDDFYTYEQRMRELGVEVQPTVEDVLTEFGIDWEHESDCEDRAALLKEYAAKLRLVEEDA